LIDCCPRPQKKLFEFIPHEFDSAYGLGGHFVKCFLRDVVEGGGFNSVELAFLAKDIQEATIYSPHMYRSLTLSLSSVLRESYALAPLAVNPMCRND